MTALHGTEVPVPATYALCADAEVTGAPFYVMQRVDGTAYRRVEHGVAQASLVIIRHTPRIVQAASQAMMTQTAWVADSGSSDYTAPGRATPPATPGSPYANGSPDGSRCVMASPTTERCRSCKWGDVDRGQEHSFGEVTRSRRAAHRDRDDEAEGGQEASYQDPEDHVAAGGRVGVRGERVE
jgi:hypothetical protein